MGVWCRQFLSVLWEEILWFQPRPQQLASELPKFLLLPVVFKKGVCSEFMTGSYFTACCVALASATRDLALSPIRRG